MTPNIEQDIIALRPTNNATTTYGRKVVYFTAPLGETVARLYLYCPSTNTGICYFDDATITLAEYEYRANRNLDGSGANDWYAGDAVFNTGTTGDGWIDLYSMSGMNAAATRGRPLWATCGTARHTTIGRRTGPSAT